MRILILSRDGDSLGLATRLVDEDHHVQMYIKNGETLRHGIGMVERVYSWRPELAMADLVLCDSADFGLREEVIRKSGTPVLGCSLAGHGLTRDRFNQCRLLRKLGIATPHFLQVNLRDAWDFNRNWEAGGVYVKGQTTVYARTRNQYEFLLTRAGVPEFLLQEEVVGQQFRLVAFHNGLAWVKPYLVSVEEFGLLSSNTSYYRDCTGAYVAPEWSEERLYHDVLEKLDPFLKSMGYRGPVALNCVVTEDGGVYALNCKLELPFLATDAFLGTLQEPLADILFELASGVKKELHLGTDNCAAVGVTLPPWPVSDAGIMTDLPLGPIEAAQKKYISFKSAYFDEGTEEYRASGGDGEVLKVLARGTQASQVQRRVYRTITNLNIPFAQYREDVGARAVSTLQFMRQSDLIR